MAVSGAARDIRAALGDGAYVDRDTTNHISLEVPNLRWLSEETIDTIAGMFRGHRDCPIHCGVDLESSVVNLKAGGCTFDEPAKPRKTGLVGTTESEKMLVQVASSLGTIDFDDLIPVFELHDSDQHSILHILGLLHVSHDSLLHHTKGYSDLTVRYDMQNKSVHLLLPRLSKRKR